MPIWLPQSPAPVITSRCRASALERGPGLKAKGTHGAPGIQPLRLAVRLVRILHHPTLKAGELGDERDKLSNIHLLTAA